MPPDPSGPSHHATSQPNPLFPYPPRLQSESGLRLGDHAAGDPVLGGADGCQWPSLRGFPTAARSTSAGASQRPVCADRNTASMTAIVFTASSQVTGTSPPWRIDRKSTRLNSSHLVISYAVFCF